MMIHDIRRDALIKGKESSMLPPASKGFTSQSPMSKISSPKMKRIRTLESLKAPSSQERSYEEEETL